MNNNLNGEIPFGSVVRTQLCNLGTICARRLLQKHLRVAVCPNVQKY